jgi:hypothetical protein
MHVQVVRADGRANEWYVALDGIYALGFSGPDAHDRAEACREELESILIVSVPRHDQKPDERSQRDLTSVVRDVRFLTAEALAEAVSRTSPSGCRGRHEHAKPAVSAPRAHSVALLGGTRIRSRA